jgi:hypothetical protein
MYIATDLPRIIQVDPFIPSNLFHTYYIIYYLELWDDNKALWTRDIPYNLFNFTQGGRDPTITIYTFDNFMKGSYKMHLMGKFTPNTVFKAVSPFALTVLDQCYLTKITIPPDLPSTLIFNIAYPPSSPLILNLSPWTLSVP